LGDLLRDLRLALRALARTPGFSVAAVLTLALGIGAATAIYSMVDTVLLRPFPFEAQEELTVLWGEFRARRQPLVEVSLQDYGEWRAGNRVFSDLAIFSATATDCSLREADRAVHVRAHIVSSNFFETLGVAPVLGRAFTADEEKPGAPWTAVVSHEFWRSRMNSDPRAAGRQVPINGASYTVVGVMPRAFRFPDDTDLWVTPGPLAGEPGIRVIRIFKAVGRLKPGVTLEQARRGMETLSVQLERKLPRTNQDYRAVVRPLVGEMLGDTRPALHLLMGAVVLLLLIACANVAGLLLARAAARQKETAVRTALGAGRARLVRQFLTESLVIAALAGALGLLIAYDVLLLVSALDPGDIPRLDEVRLDGRALSFTLLASMAALLISGLVPALRASRLDLAPALKEGARSSTGAHGTRLRGLLVAAEVALALVLLVGADLVIRSFLNLARTDLGFRPEGVLTMRVTLQDSADEATPEEHAGFFREALRRVEAVPGVRRAALVLLRPLSGPIGWDYRFVVEGQPADEQRTNPLSNHEAVSPGYFRTLGIPLREGRDFTWGDDAPAPKVAIVSESLARRFWPGRSALGRRIRIFQNRGEAPWLTIVGVAADVHYRELEAVRPDIYVPFPQWPHWAMDLVVLTGSPDPLSLAPSVTDAVQTLDPDHPISGITTLEEAVSDSVARPRLRSFLMGVFAGLALLLAAVGLYGIVAYSVAQRRHEIGIRLALGANPGAVLLLVLRQALALTLAGLAAGLALAMALASTGWISGLLYQVEPIDLLTFATIPLLLVAVAVAAALIPARRATEVDPLVALRSE
jgi:putative ABC transport system permease protein